jgi:signal transduction histidine kinase
VVSTFRRLRAWIESHPIAADTSLAAAALGAAIVSSRVTIELYDFGDPAYRPPSHAAELGGLVMTIAPLALRRRAPLLAALACAAGFFCSRLLLDAVEPTVTAVVISVAVFSAAAHGRGPWRNWVCAVCGLAVLGELGRELANISPPGQPDRLLYEAFVLLFYLALFAATWALGNAIGAGRRRARELLDRTRALEHEREENARRAVFDERVRIARELHDVVAHHVSIMGVQAGAARMVMARDPARAAGSLASIETSSRQAVEELHRLLGFLRQADEPDELAPSPSVSQLPDLAGTMSNSDITVEVSVEGEARPLPPTVDVSAYRIVQEALTNTLKHATASRADVHLRYSPGEVEVEVVDDGRGAPNASGRPGGLGLIGMRERAALHGGRLTTGPAPGGGFAVRVTLPTPDGAL